MSQDTSIFIMKPDKGNRIVILDRDDYVKKTEVILEDHSELLMKIALKLATAINHEFTFKVIQLFLY